MSVIGRLRERRSMTVEEWLDRAMLGRETESGVRVTPRSALRHADVYACIAAIHREVSSCPLKHYEREGDDSRKAVHPIPGMPAYALANPSPGLLTSGALWGLVAAHLNGWGEAFVVKYRSRGIVQRLFPLHPKRVQVGMLNGAPFYLVQPDGDSTFSGRFTRKDIIHFKGFSLDGVRGLSPLEVAREAVGLGIAQENYASRTLARDGNPRGVLFTKLRGLDDTAKRRLKREWDALTGKDGEGSSTALLDKDTDDFKPISVSPADLDFVEQRKLSTIQIARIFGVPGWVINAPTGESMTYTTVESQRLAFAMSCIRYWFSNIEATIAADPDFYPEDGSTFPEFLMDAMLRADSATRARNNALAIGRWKTPNEIRREEGDPDIEGGDELKAPSTPPPAADPGGVHPPADPNDPINDPTGGPQQ